MRPVNVGSVVVAAIMTLVAISSLVALSAAKAKIANRWRCVESKRFERECEKVTRNDKGYLTTEPIDCSYEICTHMLVYDADTVDLR